MSSEHRPLKDLIYLVKTDPPSGIIWENHDGVGARITLPVVVLVLYTTLVCYFIKVMSDVIFKGYFTFYFGQQCTLYDKMFSNNPTEY